MKKASIITALFLAVMAGFVACVKTEFDQPPISGTPVNVTPDMTIKELRQLHVSVENEGFDRITEDRTIAGVVVMNDRSGNFYKTIVIQDETGGIEVKFNDGFLYNDYPIGRTIYIKVKDLFLTNYGGSYQLIGGTIEEAGVLRDAGITTAQESTQIIKGLVSPTPPTPKKITLADVNNSENLSTLIQLDDVQFIGADTAKTYADPVTKNSLNRTLEFCDGSGNIVVRSSGYSNFTADKTSGRGGSIIAVLGTFNETPQLAIRDLNDISFGNNRCVNVCGEIGGNVTVDNLNETFATAAANTNIKLSGWSNIGTDGCRLFRGAVFNNNPYAQVSAFQSQDPSNESWFITPAITATSAKTLNFESSWSYFKHQGLTVWMSTNFDGTNFGAATWTKLPATFALESDKDTNPNFSKWIASAPVAIPASASGKVHIGFKYIGNEATNTTTWRIDNVKVQ